MSGHRLGDLILSYNPLDWADLTLGLLYINLRQLSKGLLRTVIKKSLVPEVVEATVTDN